MKKKMLIVISHLVIREVKMDKYTMRYHQTPITIAKIKKKNQDAKQKKYTLMMRMQNDTISLKYGREVSFKRKNTY